jgi:hypothetical protein
MQAQRGLAWEEEIRKRKQKRTLRKKERNKNAGQVRKTLFPAH